jgi:tetratricopeptide (TPR) repeat protein
MGRVSRQQRLLNRGDRERPASVPLSIESPQVDPAERGSRTTVFAICALLLLAVLAIYGQTVRFDFVNFDDNEYVYENSHVCNGLTREGFAWAFTDRVSSQWAPVTLLSLMADAQLIRPWSGKTGLARLAAGMHLINVVLHAANVLLLFLILRAMTGRLWPSALAAAIFAVHPLHVESVAWITERKDVLSGLFGLLAIAAYIRYSRRPSVPRYLIVAALLALGLMAKPMLVTWPLVFLLLDFWPLRRPFSAGLLAEKAPLLLMVAAISVVTIQGQSADDAVFSLTQVPLWLRMVRAAELYVVYLGKTVWPVNLAALYPDAQPASFWRAIGAGSLLVLLTAGATWLARCGRQWTAVGWYWYLITLVPVIGLVQVGAAVMADRFMYLPQIGLCVIFAWSIAAWAGASANSRWVAGVASLLTVASLGACAWRQTAYWKDSETLWKHTLACTSGTWAAHNNLGIALDSRRRFEEAIDQFHEALAIRPYYVKSHFNLANAYTHAGRTDDAINEYRIAIAIKPDHEEAHRNLGISLDLNGDLQGAIAEHLKALQIKPDFAEAHHSLGVILAKHGQFDDAIVHFKKALEIKPGFVEARKNLNTAWAKKASSGPTVTPWP